MPDPTPERWRRVRDAFDAVADRPSGERGAALTAACTGPDGAPDAALRAEVEALLAADEADSVLDQAAASTGAALVAEALVEPAPLGERVGPWRVVGELGRGGMGTVLLVERADGAYDQRAALKRIALVGPGRVRRFEQERQILAGLDHPGIARLLDGGLDADGAPYLVMEAVDGQPITRWADDRGLPVADRVRLFLQVCEAVGHAHRHLVVHRDLKPSNVLVTEDGRVKLLDFGIAKLLHPAPAGLLDDADAAEPGEPLTGTGLPLLTPEYAAPEQVTGGPVTTATDVYALGALLYELLAGQRPYEIERRTLQGVVEAITETRPARPSDAAPDDRQRALRGDLDTVVLKALDKEPARRYGSADDLAADLRRALAGQPVEARAPTAGYRARRFVGRHRAGVAAAALVVLAVLGGLGATAWQARAARVAAAESAATADFLADLLGAADPLAEERRDTLRVAALLDEGAARVRAELDGQPRVQARLLHVLGRTYRRLERWDESEPLLRDALALYRRLDAAPATLADVLGELALTQSARAEHDEAVSLAGEALALAHADGGPETLLRAERTLGGVRMRALPPRGPDSLLLVARDRARALYSDGHLTAAELELELGEAYLDAGQVEEAVRHVRQATEDAARALGPDHPRLIAYHLTLAFASLFGGHAEEAEAAAARAVALARATSPGSNRLGQALTLHAQALRRLGRLDQAAAELREAIPLTVRRPVDRATPLGTLASVLDASGDLAGAIDAQTETFRLLRSGAGERPVVVTSGLKLADLLTRAGRHAAAEATLDDVTAARRGLDLPNEAFAAQLDRQLAAARVALYEAWGRPRAADPFRALAASGSAHDGRAPAASSHGAEVGPGAP